MPWICNRSYSFTSGTESFSLCSKSVSKDVLCYLFYQIAHTMAQTAEKMLRQGKAGLPIKIEALKEPDHCAVGNGTGIMYVIILL